MADRLKFGLFLAAVVAATLWHQPLFLAGLALAVFLVAGKWRFWVLRRAMAATLVFGGSVTLGYVVWREWTGAAFPGDFLFLFNLRLFALSSLGLAASKSIDFFRLVRPFPTLRFFLVLFHAQSRALFRAKEEFALAMESRSIRSPGIKERYRRTAAQAGFLLEKALSAGEENAKAMRSRGVFDV